MWFDVVMSALVLMNRYRVLSTNCWNSNQRRRAGSGVRAVGAPPGVCAAAAQTQPRDRHTANRLRNIRRSYSKLAASPDALVMTEPAEGVDGDGHSPNP